MPHLCCIRSTRSSVCEFARMKKHPEFSINRENNGTDHSTEGSECQSIAPYALPFSKPAAHKHDTMIHISIHNFGCYVCISQEEL